MTKIRRRNFVFVTWIGDHAPSHVHVYRDGQLIVKWDLEHSLPIEGRANRRLQRLIRSLVKEGLL